MKPVWNSLLLALNLVILPAGTSVVLASPTTPIPEKKTITASTTEITTPHILVSAETTGTQTTQEHSPLKPDEEKKPDPNSAATPTSEKLQQKLEEKQRLAKYIEADRLYLGGQYAAAEKIYREVKTPFAKTTADEPQKRLEPIVDPDRLPPAGRVYWREAQAASGQKLKTKVMVPLRLLIEQYPQFIPGQLLWADTLQKYDRPKEALDVLEQATSLYPEQPDLVKAKVAALSKEEKWMDASLFARQYALLHPNQPDAPQMSKLADENLERYKKHLRRELRGNAIANVITGVAGYALTGSLLGPFSAVQTTTMLVRGESSVGESVAKDARKQLELVEDKEVVDYVNEIGQKLAHVAGRNDFKYEFYVVLDDDLNAFALPGGKVFVNAGAIAKTNSEAELAGLLAHELSHAVLSHGFQLIAEGNLVANVTQFVPYGGTIADLFTLDYSRDMERQADTLGTRLLASTGYAADGLYNLMVTLEQQEKTSPPSWLSSHPATRDRVHDLKELIQRNHYNRYAYEGVERHSTIKEKVKKLLVQKEQHERKKHQDN